ncbi:MAG: hypothetical protein WCQ55_05525 [Paludibacteraceae bacterium]
MKRIVIFLTALGFIMNLGAQNKVKITESDGSTSTYLCSDIESIDFSSDNNFSIIFKNGATNISYEGNADRIEFEKQASNSSVSIKRADGWFESGFIEWEETTGYSSFHVYCRESGKGDYTLLDSELVRNYGSFFRADALGLAAGSYQFKIVPVKGDEEQPTLAAESGIIHVTNHDRSGYAHFNYTEGVGAYKDDGTLKDGAIVIYVTDENKDQIKIPGYESAGVGLGWLLNNAQYSKSGSNTYTENASNLGIYSITKEHPVVIRFLGKINPPEGLTAYNSTNNGGSTGDNGFMARMKDARNLTIEGIGSDAMIYGWGFHFICSDMTGEYGKNFEARNLTFDDYPEDALGMEGMQGTINASGTVENSSSASADICAPVQHCWIHNCNFKQGYCANPAESDKAEGDGSCDFKRGRFYTLSYCYFEYGHKTNLIGSGDASLQFDISFHHNIWNNCASRIPLLRNANFHFYNNYVFGDMTDEEASLSYVASVRANSYLYSENNYYDGCKNVCQTTSGGVSKSYGNIYYACFGDNDATIATSRTQNISSTCKFTYKGIDYENFDTNPTLFYYNSSEEKTRAYITDAVTARQECIKNSGVQKEDSDVDVSMNKNSVSEAIDLSGGTFSATIGTSESGIVYTNISSSGKFKGQGITFRIDEPVSIELTAGSDSYGGPYLVKSDGTVIGQIASSATFELTSGTYFIGSGSKDKESQIKSLKMTVR